MRHFLYTRIASPLLAMFGLGLVRTSSGAFRARMDRAVAAIARRTPGIRGVIDVGASTGIWSAMAARHLRNARFLLIEAQADHERALAEHCRRHPGAIYRMGVAGGEPGVLYFDARDPFGGIASKERKSADDLELQAVTVDQLVAECELPAPFLLKLDTHGFELPILEGAAATLARAEAVVIECYNHRIAEGSLLFHEMCAHMDRLGFRCIDAADPLFRPKDDTFWQIDLVFVRADRPEFQNNAYR